eukprot:793539-Amphidinium_carterae.1
MAHASTEKQQGGFGLCAQRAPTMASTIFAHCGRCVSSAKASLQNGLSECCSQHFMCKLGSMWVLSQILTTANQLATV